MKSEEQISKMSGISKRLFVALSNFRSNPPQLEDALFQLSSVIDSTSKHHYPSERSSKDRFVKYLDSVATEFFIIATRGHARLTNCTFKGLDGKQHSFGEVIYGIRCSSYHDPNEVDDLIHWGKDNTIGVNNGRFVVTQPMLQALFFILLTDDANKDMIDTDLFNDEHFLIERGKQYPFHSFIGRRDELFRVLNLLP